MPLCLPGLPDGNSTRIYKRKCKEPVKNGTAPLKNGTAPHHLASQGAGCRSCLKRQFGKKSPPRGSLDARQGFTFLPKKMKFTEFFFRQGEAAKRLTIFALLCASTMRQGEATKWLTIFAEEMKFAEFFSGKGKAWKEEEI